MTVRINRLNDEGGIIINYRIAFSALGSLFLLMGGFLVIAAFMTQSAPLSETYTILSMSVMAFCLSYLYPQFVQKDERMQLIRQKGMFFTFFAFLFYSFTLNLLVEFEVAQLTASEVLNILTALMISTLFTSWVFLARRY